MCWTTHIEVSVGGCVCVCVSVWRGVKVCVCECESDINESTGSSAWDSWDREPEISPVEKANWSTGCGIGAGSLFEQKKIFSDCVSCCSYFYQIYGPERKIKVYQSLSLKLSVCKLVNFILVFFSLILSFFAI